MSTGAAIVIGVLIYVIGTIINNIVMMKEMRGMISDYVNEITQMYNN